ncbi:MAG TPA: hypothetical protein VFE58_16685 [Tepidisphaeraceae bacterium]|jgi:hypothetical protein|nr:hypothetical protein [Tepidisphaeraceae bacterium]
MKVGLTLAWVLTIAISANASVQYNVIALQDFDGGDGVLRGLNNNGQTVGWGSTLTGQNGTILWSNNGAASPVPQPPFTGMVDWIPYGITNSGVVVGAYSARSTTFTLFAWDGHNTYVSPQIVGDARTGFAFNSTTGVISVSTFAGTTNEDRAYTWDWRQPTQIPFVASDHVLTATNNLGSTTGYVRANSTAWLSIGGQVFTYSPPSGYVTTRFIDINDNNIAVGYALSSSDITNNTQSRLALLYTPDAGVTILPNLAGSFASGIGSINNSNVAVGYSEFTTPTGTFSHGAEWIDGQPYDLNSLIPAGSGWVLGSTGYISDTGYIVGSGTYNGTIMNYLLVPAPEPSTGELAVAALGFVLGRLRRSSQCV